MSYVPLHHKYRPQSFAELVGQDAIATTLRNAVLTNKIAPAYLFSGPRGTGKTSSARILAKSLNCLAVPVPTPNPCGVCEVCRGITNGSALDVIEIDAASNTGVDNIRELIERAQFAPVQCRYKVYAIDECHMLSTAAFNALLKTLEEPPAHVVFVLATTDPQRVLPTIISRCQRFDFRRIPFVAMVGHLQAIAAQENIQIATAAVELIAQISQGGLRDAQSLLDQLSLLSGEITVDRVWDLVGAVAEPDLIAMLQAIAHNDPEAVLDCARSLMERGREPLTILQNLASCYRDLLIAQTAPNRHDLAACTPATWQALCDLAHHWDIATILHGQQHLKNSEVQIRTSTQPRLWLEVTLLGLLPVTMPSQLVTNGITHLPQPTQISPLPVRVALVQPTPPPPTVESVSAVEPPAQAVVEPISPPPPVVHHDNPAMISRDLSPEVTAAETTDLAQIWQQLLQSLPLPSKALFKEHGSLLSFNEQHAAIAIRSQKLQKIAQTKVLDLESAFSKIFSHKVKVQLVVAGANQPDTTSGQKPLVPAVDLDRPVVDTSFERAPQLSDAHNGSAIAPVVSYQPSAAIAPVEITTSDQLSQSDAPVVEDEIAIAAQNLADFFKGEVIKHDRVEFTPATNNLPLPTAGEWNDADLEPDHDVDF